jgi:probable F420-dependent oxidoreductase
MSNDLKIEAGIQRTPGETGLSDDIEKWATTAEEFGFDGFMTSEVDYDGLAPLPLIAEYTDDVDIGTNIVTAFSRSPMIHAYNAWGVQRYSGGRHRLGLGTQVKAHNERRFSVPWHGATSQLREVVEAIQHIWHDVFQENDSKALDYQGEYYSFDLMTDFFNPGPIDNPDIPIYIAALNKGNARLAGELCDGITLHVVNSPSFIKEKINKWVAQGAEKADRNPDDIEVVAAPYVITGETEEEVRKEREKAREEIAFYGSTPSYHVVFEHHGWLDTGKKLHELSREQKFEEAQEHVTDEIIDTMAVQAPVNELGGELREQYGGIADRLYLSIDFDGSDWWRDVIDGVHGE